MRRMRMRPLVTALLLLASFRLMGHTALASQQPPPAGQTAAPPAQPARGNPKDTEVWEPVPAVVTPGAADSAPPSDAIVLFDGTNLDQWVATKDKSPAGWTVADGVLTVDKKTGNIETKRSFKNYQLHLEWRIPVDVTGTDQARGNSGVFLASTGAGDAGYELQILDSYNNKTYVNGQAGSIYKQGIPLANASAQARRVAGLRRGLDGADVQRRRLGEDAGLRDGVPQRRAGAEPLRAEGRDALHRQAGLQEVRRRADQAAGARRPEPADQLPEHLGARAQVAARLARRDADG